MTDRSPAPFREVLRHRSPVVVAPLTTTVDLAGDDVAQAYDEGLPLPRPAPSAAAEVDLAGPGPVTLRLTAPGLVLEARRSAAGAVRLVVEGGGRTTAHRARRRAVRLVGDRSPARLALALTGHVVAVLALVDGDWVALAAVDLHRRGRGPREDGPGTLPHAVRTPRLLGSLRIAVDDPTGRVTGVRAGGFGHLGLRDVRLVTTAEGEPVRDADGRLRLTATHAGAGFFGTAHCGAWTLDPVTLDLAHTGDLWTTRHGDDRVLGDHAVHVVRDGAPGRDEWLVATSTWGDFDAAVTGATVGTALARTTVDPLVGEQVLATDPWPLPAPAGSVGTWDPHLLRDRDRWLVAFVSATRFFRFGPALAAGPSLDDLALVAADARRTATEGVTLARLGGELRVLAADGPDSPARVRRRWPVLDLGLREVGTLEGPFPTNIPWPTVVPLGEDEGGGWLMATFDGTTAGGPALGYGTHGDLVVLRASEPGGPERV